MVPEHSVKALVIEGSIESATAAPGANLYLIMVNSPTMRHPHQQYAALMLSCLQLGRDKSHGGKPHHVDNVQSLSSASLFLSDSLYSTHFPTGKTSQELTSLAAAACPSFASELASLALPRRSQPKTCRSTVLHARS